MFISYAYKDEMYKDELRAHLAIMEQNKKIKAWDGKQIGGGEEWEYRIFENFRFYH